MARFFKPTMANNIDFMKELPIEMMMKGIATTEAANDQIFAQTDLLGNAVAKVNHLSSDSERVQAKQKEYADQIQAVTQDLMADPTNYRKKMPLVRDLTRTLSTDMQSGELAAIQSNATKLAEWEKTYKPLVASGKYSPDAYNRMKSAFIQNYGGIGYDKATGNYNQLQTEDMYQTQDFNKLIGEAVKGIKANSRQVSGESGSADGRWIITHNGKEETVSAARIAQIATDSVMGDQNAMGYLRQGAKYGYLQGVTGEDGKFIDPYTVNADGTVEFNPQSILAAPIRAAVGREAFRETSSTTSSKANPYQEAAETFQRDLYKIQLNDKVAQDRFVTQEALKHANAKDLADYKSAIKRGDAEAIANIKAGIVAGATGAKAGTLSFTQKGDPEAISWNLYGGQDKKVTNEKLVQSIEEIKSTALINRKMASDENLSENERSLYMANAIAAEKDLREKSQLAHIARTDANRLLQKNGFSQNDIKVILPEVNARIKDVSTRLEALTKAQKYEYKVNNSGSVVSGGNKSTPPPNQAQMIALHNQLTHLKKLKNADDNHITSWFKENQEQTTHQINGIGTSPAQQKMILETMAASPDMFKVLNNQNQDKKQAEASTGRWDKIKQGGFLNHPEIGGTVEEMAKKFDVVSINAPTAGMPASITLKTKGKDGFMLNNTIEGTFVVPISGDLQKTLGADLAKSTNAKAKQVGALINDFTTSTLIAELQDKIINHKGGGMPAGFAYLPSQTVNGKTYTPQAIVSAVGNKTNTSAGELGLYRAKISLPNGALIDAVDEDGKIAEYASVEEAAKGLMDMYKPK